MKGKRKTASAHADFRFQISIAGFDSNGRDTMLIVRADDTTDFENSIVNALGVCPLTANPNGKSNSVADSKQPPPAPQAAAQCPRCGAACYDNRSDPDRGNRPLVKCKKCAWRLWENPRNDSERADNALWDERGRHLGEKSR